jgi:hypothetical protein
MVTVKHLEWHTASGVDCHMEHWGEFRVCSCMRTCWHLNLLTPLPCMCRLRRLPSSVPAGRHAWLQQGRQPGPQPGGGRLRLSIQSSYRRQ